MGKKSNIAEEIAAAGRQDEENVITIKKLSRDERLKIKKAIKKKKRSKANTKFQEDDNRKQILEYINQEYIDPVAEKAAIEAAKGVEIELVEMDEYLLTGKHYEDYKHVFANFKSGPIEDNLSDQEGKDDDGLLGEAEKLVGGRVEMSKKQKKRMKRMQVAQLKVLVKRPDLVEAWDVTAPDPLLLIQ